MEIKQLLNYHNAMKRSQSNSECERLILRPNSPCGLGSGRAWLAMGTEAILRVAQELQVCQLSYMILTEEKRALCFIVDSDCCQAPLSCHHRPPMLAKNQWLHAKPAEPGRMSLQTQGRQVLRPNSALPLHFTEDGKEIHKSYLVKKIFLKKESKNKGSYSSFLVYVLILDLDFLLFFWRGEREPFRHNHYNLNNFLVFFLV